VRQLNGARPQFGHTTVLMQSVPQRQVREVLGEVSISPEFVELQGRFEAAKTELAKVVSDRDYLLTTVKTNLETRYYQSIGRKEYELFLIRCEVLRLRRKIELIQASLNRGEEPNLDHIEKHLDKELEEWTEKARALWDKISRAEFVDQLPTLTLADTHELKKLYRELVRRLHPDINPDLPEESRNLWERVLSAYLNGDLEELRTLSMLFLEYETSPNNPSTMEQLALDVERLTVWIKRLLQELAELEKEFPFNYQHKLDDPKWVKVQQDVILKQIGEMQRQRDKYLAILTGMGGTGQLIH